MSDTFAHYTRMAKIGQGGMGEVYRAHDSQLGRDVALKFLPDVFATDPERLARFEREAKVLAALNHPNIAAIYAIAQDGDRRALTLEFVDGEDFSQRLARGPIPADEAIEIALQIAEALAAAHASDVIHRDLKPANVKRAPDGRVKVLDFGLAKAVDPTTISGSPSDVDLTQSPTLMSAGTMQGVILGTAAYMSPEQARGQVVDRRTDIWAFGCVLFEMLTGRQAFSGETVSDTLAAVLKTEPDWDALPAGLPAGVRRIIERCLVKNPRERWHDITDVALLLREAAAGTTGAESGETVATPARAPRAPVLFIAGAAIILVAAVVFYLATRGGSGPSVTPARYTFTQLTVQSAIESRPKLSPDGSFILFEADEQGNDDIFLQRIGGFNAINLTQGSTDDDYSAAFSPDGQRIAFRSDRQNGGVYIMGATGESERKLCDVGFEPAWWPDGRSLVVCEESVPLPWARDIRSALWRVDATTGDTTRIYDGDAVQASVSPRGLRIAFWSVEMATGGWRDISTIAPDGSDRVAVTNDAFLDFNPVWSHDGRYLYFGSDRGGSLNLWRVPIDERTGAVLGALEPVTAPAAEVMHFDVSKDGANIVYTAVHRTSHIVKFTFDPVAERVTKRAEVTSGSLHSSFAEVSPDGEWVAFAGAAGQEDIYIVRGDGSDIRKITDDGYRDRGPSWSPDGRSIVFYSDRNGRYEVWSIDRDGSGARQLTDNAGKVWYPRWSPDGKRLHVRGSETTTLFEAKDLSSAPWGEADATTLPVTAEGYYFLGMSWSLDGRQLTGVVLDATLNRLPMVATCDVSSRTYRYFATNDSTRIASVVWLHDGHRLLVQKAGTLDLLDTNGNRWKTLVDSDEYLTLGVSVSRDDKAIYTTSADWQSDIWMATATE